MASTFSPSTWRVLGLSVAVGFTGLGTSAIISPSFASRVFGLKPIALTQSDPTTRSFALLGVRDLSIGAALFTFNSRNWPEAMGVLISSSMILCAYDVYEVARNNGLAEGLLIGVGAGIWGLIGYGLLGLKSFE